MQDNYLENEEDYSDFDEDELVSKSQKKRDMHALQALAEQALRLSDEKLAETGLDGKTLAAFKDIRKMKASGARKRQLKYITKLISHEDSSILENLLQQADEKKQHENHLFHQLENLRERLIEEGDHCLPEVLDLYPAADRQHLRTLIRQAQKEKAAEKPPAASRKLFKYLRTLSG